MSAVSQQQCHDHDCSILNLVGGLRSMSGCLAAELKLVLHLDQVIQDTLHALQEMHSSQIFTWLDAATTTQTPAAG